MVKPKKVYNKQLWEDWVMGSQEYFDDIIAPCKLAIFIGESDKNCLVIEKIADSLFPSFEINGSFSMYDFDLFFTVAENDAVEILEDSSKFPEFVKSGKLGILCTVDDIQMEQKGLDKFLSTLGFSPSCSI
ncbi:MAG: hypothetical protein Q4P14_01765 [Methanobacteriaceae archaeon]|nr:hypothetical protein [Methanobacteriaceae archaeon]